MSQIINNGMAIQMPVNVSEDIAPGNIAAAHVPAGEIGVAGTAAGALGPVRNFGAITGQQNVPVPTGADLAANVAEGRCAKMARWFTEGTPSMRRTGGLPANVEVNVGTADNPKNINYKNTELASMVNCLPRMQRAAAREALPQLLAARINHGQEVTQSVLDDTRTGSASLQDVADVMLFLDGKSHAQGVGFSEGAFSIEDSEGRLYDFLNTAPDKYLRSSTHLSSQQGATIGVPPNTHSNAHRGIDFPKGAEQGLPTGKRTVLFCAIPAANGQNRRIFMKPESNGCRLSTLSHVNRLAGRDNIAERTVNWKTDFGQFLGHAGGAIASTARKIFNIEVGAARKERIPSAVKEAFAAFVKEVPNQAIRVMLTANNPTDDAQGIRTMLANIRSAIEGLPAGVARNDLALMAKGFTDTLGLSLLDARHAQNRIGNEVLFDASEIQAGMQDDNPIEMTDRDKQRSVREALTNPTDAQKILLAGLGSDFQLQAMTALPEIRTALDNIAGVDKENTSSVKRAIHSLYDSIGTSLQRLDKSVDDVIEFTTKTIQLASSSMSQASLRGIYTLLSTPEAIRQREEIQIATQNIALGARGDESFTQVAGIVGRMLYYLPATVTGIEAALDIAEADYLPAQANLSHMIHQANVDIITPHPLLDDANNPILGEDGNPRMKDIDPNGISAVFVKDCIERSGVFTVAGQNGGGRLTTEAMVMEALPNPAMRAAVTSLASQSSLACFSTVLNATGMYSRAHGVMLASAPGTRKYSFDLATGIFKAKVEDKIERFIHATGKMMLLRESSSITYEYSCKLLQDDNGTVFIEERNVEAREGMRDEVLAKGTEAFMDTSWTVKPAGPR